MGTNLTFKPLNDLTLIPRYLIEQIRDCNIDIDKFYMISPLLLSNPFNFFGGFFDKELIKGFLWGVINPLDMSIMCNILSIDKEYQGLSILKETKGILEKIKKNNNCKAIYFITTRPKAMKKAGFKLLKHCKMEV